MEGQLPLLVAFMLVAIGVMGGLSWIFAKYMKQRALMEDE